MTTLLSGDHLINLTAPVLFQMSAENSDKEKLNDCLENIQHFMVYIFKSKCCKTDATPESTHPQQHQEDRAGSILAAPAKEHENQGWPGQEGPRIIRVP